MLKKIFKSNIFLNIFTFLFSIMLFLSSKIVLKDKIFGTLKDNYVSSYKSTDIFTFLIILVLSYILVYLFNYLFSLININGQERKRNIKIYLLFSLIILVCWLPYLLSYFPGGLYADTYTSLSMALKQASLNNHHPILYTLSWRLVLFISKLLGQGTYFGIGLFTIFQSFIMIFSLSLFVYWLYIKGFSKWYYIICLLFFALCPLFPFYAISLWKDTPFSCSMFLLTVFLLNILYDNDPNIILQKKNIIILYILIFLVSFGRNNGIYISLFTSIFLMIYLLKNNKNKKQNIIYSISLLFLLLLIYIIQGPIYNKLGYNTDSKVESLGMPLQQVSYVIEENGEITKKDLKFINNIMTIDNIKNKYRPLIVDPIKWDPSFNKSYFDNNSKKFMKVYFRVVKDNPKMVFNAFILENLGYWSPRYLLKDAYINNFMWSSIQYKMNDYFKKMLGFSFRKIVEPPLYISYAIYIWIMLFTIFVLISRKKYYLVISLLPCLGLWLTIMIATPLAYSFRYVYSIFMIMPMCITLLLEKKY